MKNKLQAMAALEVICATHEYLEQVASPAEGITINELCEFINSTDRNQLHRKLRREPISHEAAALLDPRRESLAKDVFFKTRQFCGGVERIGFESEKRAEINALLTIIDDLIGGETPPSISDVSTTQVIMDEPEIYVVSAEIQDWLEGLQCSTLSMMWNSVPRSYEEALRAVTSGGTETTLLFGNSIMNIIQEELINVHPATSLSPTVRQWLNSISQDNSLNMFISPEDVDFCLFVSDTYAIVGYFARENSPGGAFLRTSDTDFHQWASRVFEKHRKRSCSVQMPLRFQGDNPYLAEQDTTTQK